MQALTAHIQIFYSLRGKLGKSQPFQYDKSARPWSLGSSKNYSHPKFTQRSYTVTQLRSCIRCNWAVTLGRKKYFILLYIIYYINNII